MSMSNPSPPTAVPYGAAPPAGTTTAQGIRLAFAAVAWGVLGATALAIAIGIVLLVRNATRTGGDIAAAVIWMKYAVVLALYWMFALRSFGHGFAALKLAGAVEPHAVDLRMACRDKFARASGLLGDLNLAMVFESLIVFFLLLCWAIFAFNPVVLALTILTLPAAAGHWWMTVLIQDTLGDRVERA